MKPGCHSGIVKGALMSQEDGNHSRERQIKIEISDEIADGIYANTAFIASNKSEFILDFARYLPGNTRGKIVSRVVMNPINAKAFLKALSESVERYEKDFGAISAETVNKNIGFAINTENGKK
jgi:hypothetical protein